MGSLVVDNYWVGLNIVNNSDDGTFKKFLSMVTSLENSTDTSQWVKWKNYAHQVVIQTPKYFYKLYEEYPYEGFLNCKIREILARIYKNYGILWNIQTIYEKDKIYQIEQREKLQLCSQDIIPFEELLLNWNKTLIQIEEELKLNKINPQLPPPLDKLGLKLIRSCVNKYEDYAIKEGKVILLDDADWFLALVDDKGEWVSSQWRPHDVTTIYGTNFSFAPLDYKSRYYKNIPEITYKLNTPNNKWMLFPESMLDVNKICASLIENREQILASTIKVLSTNQALPNYSSKNFLPEN